MNLLDLKKKKKKKIANKGQPDWYTVIFANFQTFSFRESLVSLRKTVSSFRRSTMGNYSVEFRLTLGQIRAKLQKDVNFSRTKNSLHPATILVVRGT